MSFKEMLKKIFDPKYADKKVAEINKESLKKIEASGHVAKRHAALLKKNGVVMRIYIAQGGGHD